NGILVDGHTNVTIKNGVVRSFATGIHAQDAPGVSLVNVEVRDNAFRGASVSGTNIEVKKSVFAQNSGVGLEVGVSLAPAPVGVKISNSMFVRNDLAGLVSRAVDTSLTKIFVASNEGGGIVLDETGNGTISAST